MSHLHLGAARTRALAAMLRYLHGPVLFGYPDLPTAVHCPAMRLVVAAGDQGQPLDHKQLMATAARNRVDVVGVSVDAWCELHPILFDVVLHRPDGVTWLSACRLATDVETTMFVPEFVAAEVVRIRSAGLVRTDTRPDPVARLGGIAHAQAELAAVIWGEAAAAALGHGTGGDRRPR